MGKPGRPLSSTPAWECHIHLRLREGEDDDLIRFFRSIPRRQLALATKMALRAGGMRTVELNDNVLDEQLISAAANFLD